MNDQDTPVLIELENADAPSPAEVPTISDTGAASGRAMQTFATLASRQGSPLVSWFWRLALALILFVASVAAYDFVTGLVARSPILGAAALGIFAVFSVVCLALILKELAALTRLRRVEKLQFEAAAARSGSLAEARAFADRLCGFYAAREETRWGRERLKEGAAQSFDSDTVLLLAEDTLLDPLDQQAMREIEAAARQVATITALVPMAFADVLAALTSNLTMIRRIAEIYGGRAGLFGAWRLARAVITHLVATGAVAIGDDLLGSVGGGHLLGKLSRRFGEGLVNGALTARVGIAAMEVCRPVAFSEARKPSVSALVRRALTGLFEKSEK